MAAFVREVKQNTATKLFALKTQVKELEAKNKTLISQV